MATTSKLESAVSLPFALDAYGNVKKTYDQSKIWADRVHTVIGTLKKERVMLPNFGTAMPGSLFETQSVTEETIKREVFTAFVNYLSQLTLDSVEVVFDEYNDAITAEITYSLPNQEQLMTTIGVATISGNKLIGEEQT